jgi:hypothetical protein
MEILWLAIVFYSIGLAIILHFRPPLMFNENGTWKEFGYQRGGPTPRHTIFPFWLFAVAWAFVSYALAAAISWMVPVSAATAAVAASYAPYDSEYDYDYEDEEVAVPVSQIPVRRGRGRPRKNTAVTTPRQGYYVMEPSTREGGLRKYIYYGPEAPAADDLPEMS